MVSKQKTKWFIGVDEAGRGPLAGPVAVAACALPRGFDITLVTGAKDSKQMSEKKREEVFATMRALRREGKIDFSVALVGAKTINRIGITHAVSLGIERVLRRLELEPSVVEVKLDGLLRAPKTYVKQRTIVRGDQTEVEISLASIAAKVTRDRYMVHLAKKYPEYAFEVHKGYGTALHSERIRRYGASCVHRSLFIRRLV